MSDKATITDNGDGTFTVSYTDDEGGQSFTRDSLLAAIHDVRVIFGPDASWTEGGTSGKPPLVTPVTTSTEETK